MRGGRSLHLRFIALGAATLAVWTTAPFWVAGILRAFGHPGDVAEVYEGVNALFSGLAFVGLLAALAFQRRDLRLQRRELRFQRRELEYQRRELAAAVAAQQDSARALEERLRQEESLAHQQLCVDLLREWHTAEMQRSRDVADRCVEEHRRPGGRRLIRLERFGDALDERETEEVFAVFRILHFFERLADLVGAELVDVPLAARLLGGYLHYWDENLFTLLLTAEPGHLHEIKLRKIQRLAHGFRASATLGGLPLVGDPAATARVGD